MKNLELDYKKLSGQNPFFLDYISGESEATDFFSYRINETEKIIKEKKINKRKELSRIILEYNKETGAPEEALNNAQKLGNENTFTIISGQQAGFMGGPLYTSYKIATTINISRKLNKDFPEYHFIPLFWIASEDHDFYEINNVKFIKDDGEIGKESFTWNDKGKSIYDLPVTEEIVKTGETYLKNFTSSPYYENLLSLFLPDKNASYSRWFTKILTALFGKEGLIIIEPQILRSLTIEINRKILKNYTAIREILEKSNEKLLKSGYSPLIFSDDLNMFTYDGQNRRTKIEEPEKYLKTVEEKPELLSPGALLRPILADYVLPNIISVVGSSELAYQGQIKELYKYLEVTQSVIIPRQSLTLALDREINLMEKYHIKPEELFNGNNNLDLFIDNIIPEKENELFREIENNIKNEMNKLGPLLERIDPNLEKTLENTTKSMLYNMGKLKDKTIKALLSQRGYSRKDLKSLGNLIFPHGKLQERVFPLPHFLSRISIEEFKGIILNNKDFMDFTHKFISYT